jgi:hypothetical protein
MSNLAFFRRQLYICWLKLLHFIPLGGRQIWLDFWGDPLIISYFFRPQNYKFDIFLPKTLLLLVETFTFYTFGVEADFIRFSGGSVNYFLLLRPQNDQFDTFLPITLLSLVKSQPNFFYFVPKAFRHVLFINYVMTKSWPWLLAKNNMLNFKYIYI